MRGKSAIALLLMLVFVLTCMGALAATEHTVTIDYKDHGNPLKTGSTTDYKYPTTQTVPDGAKAQEPPHDQEAGWEFKGWYKDASFNTPYNFGDLVTVDITLYAKWEQLKYTVMFDKNCTDDAVTVPAQINDVAHGSTVTKPAGYNDPTREGYTFQGWYLESSGINKFIFEGETGTANTVTQDITLYAKWERTQWTVTFATAYGVAPVQQIVNHGDTAKKPADPVAQGYRFDHWKNGDVEYNFDSTVTGNIDLTAQWTKVYKVVFNMNGHGDTIKPVSVAADETVTEPQQPTAEGYDFRGWYTDAACTNGKKFAFNASPTDDDPTINLYAKWTAKVTVSFNVVNSVTGEYDKDHPDSVQLLLYENGTAMSGKTVTFTKQSDKWVTGDPAQEEYTWDDLSPDSVYTVREVSVPENFTEVCTRKGVNNYVITNVPKEKYAVTIMNTHEADKIDIMVSKLWDDNNNKHRPGQIQVKVSWTEGSTNHEEILTLTSPDWTATLKGQYRRTAGQIIQYKIEEIDNPLGYKATCEVVVDEAGNYSVRIVNVLTGKLDIQGEKKWEDDNDRDGIRPESVQLKIYENVRDDNHLVAIVIVDNSELIGGDQSRWSWRLEDLPVYDEFDRPITYIVVEDPVPEGYTATGPQYITVNVNNNSTNN